MDELLPAFKREFSDDILTDFFDAMRQSKPKKSYRYMLQLHVRKAWIYFFKYVTNEYTEGDYTIMQDKLDVLVEEFCTTVSLMISHPKFQWKIDRSDRIPKPNGVAIDSLDYINEIIPTSRDDLRKGIRHLIEGAW